MPAVRRSDPAWHIPREDAPRIARSKEGGNREFFNTLLDHPHDPLRPHPIALRPLATPHAPLGTVLFDQARDCEVLVWGLTGARIPWPIGKPKGGRARSLVVFGDLADAVRRESAQAVCHW